MTKRYAKIAVIDPTDIRIAPENATQNVNVVKYTKNKRGIIIEVMYRTLLRVISTLNMAAGYVRALLESYASSCAFRIPV